MSADAFPVKPPPPRRLLVFARLPELGKVKTRLARDVGDANALAIYEAMLRDLLANIGDSSADTEIEFLWPPTDGANGQSLRRAFAHHSVGVQTGATLGDRLSMALSERFFFHKTRKIVVIGSDEPTLTRELIEHAFALLDSVEYVIGPATDGGYYLIGCRALSFDPVVFHDIDWGTSTVLAATLQRIASIERTVALLPERYDIDTIEDLQRYAADGHEGELAAVLRTLFSP